jgi:hypothetical protein
MTAVKAKNLLSSRRRKWLVGFLALTAVATVVCLIRAEMWPCGSLDRTSGCVSSARLDIEATGIDPTSVELFTMAFDLSSGGKSALINIEGNTEDGSYGVLALYDVQTGRMLRVIDKYEMKFSAAYFPEILAFSTDSSLAVMVSRQENGSYLMSVYRMADGRVIKSWTTENEEIFNKFGRFRCVMPSNLASLFGKSEVGRDRRKLQFSADNSKIQCANFVFDIESGSITPIEKNDSDIFPEFPLMPNSEHVDYGNQGQPMDLTEIYGSFGEPLVQLYLAPDDVGQLQVSVDFSRQSWGEASFALSAFRRVSAVDVRDLTALRRRFYSNRAYGMATWSRDAEYFGLISYDFKLELYKR